MVNQVGAGWCLGSVWNGRLSQAAGVEVLVCVRTVSLHSQRGAVLSTPLSWSWLHLEPGG